MIMLERLLLMLQKKKIKNYDISGFITGLGIGGVVVTLLMFSPLAILIAHKNLPNWLFWFIVSILYDIYIYNKVLVKEEYIKDRKRTYYNFLKKDIVLPTGKKITNEEKINSLEHFIEEIFDEFEK